MKFRFFLAILLTGTAVLICGAAFFEDSGLPAVGGTNLTTAFVASGNLGLEGHGGDWDPDSCHVTPDGPEYKGRPPVTPVSDVSQCLGDPKKCGPHCIVDITGLPVGGHAPEQILKDALLRCNTTVRLGPNVSLDYSHKFPDPKNPKCQQDPMDPNCPQIDLRPLKFGRCVTLTSVNDFNHPTSQARTPNSPGPLLHYGDPGDEKSLLSVICGLEAEWPSLVDQTHDHVRISGFRIFGTTDDQQSGEETFGIFIRRCVDVEISNMEIHGFSGKGIEVDNVLLGIDDPSHRIHDFNQVRIHDNFIHHNQHPNIGGHAGGYGVETGHRGARAHIYRNVFDFNRHAIAAAGDTGGYSAEENLILKGGGWHNEWYSRYTHIFDVHGTGCWWSDDLCGNAGEEFHYNRNSFQYLKDNAISIRGKPSTGAYITENVFPHDLLSRCCGLGVYVGVDAIFSHTPAILLNTYENVSVSDNNVTKTDTFGEYFSQCDFDGDGIDDLFLATGATWWYSSSGQFQWTFLNTSSKRKKDLRFGYFDDDNRCDVLTESETGRWLISSGGTAGWKPLEEVWPQQSTHPWKPLKEVHFGRFDPNDQSHSRQTTHAFWREGHGEWWVKKLSDPEPDSWKYVGGSDKPMKDLSFGDFTGDGVTDVLAINGGTWAISKSARESWKPHNEHGLHDPVAGLLIANMDWDDNIDDILRVDIQSKPVGPDLAEIDVVWWRSKNGVDQWREFKRYSFTYPSWQPQGIGFVYPGFSFVGRFTSASGGTLTIDEKRFGRFFTPARGRVPPAEWKSLYPY
jgi:hypothetical protein